jgi:hypothetical protein
MRSFKDLILPPCLSNPFPKVSHFKLTHDLVMWKKWQKTQLLGTRSRGSSTPWAHCIKKDGVYLYVNADNSDLYVTIYDYCHINM